MRWTLIALAAALAASASPAAACGFFTCADLALADDSYPLGNKPVPQPLRDIVAARDGMGMGLTGFYNDPGHALAVAAYAQPSYGYSAPAEPAYVGAPPPLVYAPAGVGYYRGYGVHRPYYGAHPYARPAVRQGAARYDGHPHVY